MSFPITVPQPNWEKMLSDLEALGRGGVGVAQALGQDFINEATRGTNQPQPRPIPNPAFQTTIPGQPGFVGALTGSQGRTINHPVQQYQGQQQKSFLDMLFGRNPNRPAPGTVILPGPVVPEGLGQQAGMIGPVLPSSTAAGSGGTMTGGASSDPVQMDQMPSEVARRQMERQLGGLSRLDPNAGTTRRMANPVVSDDERWSYANNSFADIAQEVNRRQQAGESVPGQDPEVLAQREAEVFENDPNARGRIRITGWDTDDVYAVVSRLGDEDYTALEEAVDDPNELLDLASDTTINMLEDAAVYMSPDLEQVFKNGIEAAMNDWYDRQVAAGRTVDITSYMMGMTQFALALVGNYGETPAVASGREAPATSYTASPTTGTTGQAAPTQFTGPNGMPTEEEFLQGVLAGMFAPEIVQGYEHFIEQNPDKTYEDFIQGGF